MTLTASTACIVPMTPAMAPRTPASAQATANAEVDRLNAMSAEDVEAEFGVYSSDGTLDASATQEAYGQAIAAAEAAAANAEQDVQTAQARVTETEATMLGGRTISNEARTHFDAALDLK